VAGKHAKLAPSAAHRWLACPGCLALCEQIPEKPDSPYAREGSAAHVLGEEALQRSRKPDEYVGEVLGEYKDWPVTEEMAEAVGVYVDFVRSLSPRVNCIPEVEHKFNLNWLYPGIWGTLDCSVFDAERKLLTIVDYKHGSGVSVQAEQNPQLMIYALGALRTLWDKVPGDPMWQRVHRVNMVIVQPRVFGEAAIREWTIPTTELYFWGLHVLAPGARAALTEGAELNAGEHCRFCDAMAICPEQAEQALALAKTDFSNPVLPPPNEMTPEVVMKVYHLAKQFSSWAGEVEQFMQNQMEMGVAYPGFKLVPRKSNRKWIDEKKAEKEIGGILGLAAYAPKKLLSVAQAEKVLAKGKLRVPENLYEKPDTGLTVAPLTDKREAVVPKTAIEFIKNDTMFG